MRTQEEEEEEESEGCAKQGLVGRTPRLSWKKPPVRRRGEVWEKEAEGLRVPDSGRRTPV